MAYILKNIQYPNGEFKYGQKYDKISCEFLIKSLNEYPAKLKDLVEKMPPEKWQKSYRPGGWTALQLTNHLSDVFINAFIRTKWLLTENEAVLKPYDQDACALLSDSTFHDTVVAVALLENLMIKWVFILENDGLKNLNKTIIHPENNMRISMGEMIAAYEWHAHHHLAHLQIIYES